MKGCAVAWLMAFVVACGIAMVGGLIELVVFFRTHPLETLAAIGATTLLVAAIAVVYKLTDWAVREVGDALNESGTGEQGKERT